MSAAAFYLYQAQKLRSAYENEKTKEKDNETKRNFRIGCNCNLGERARHGPSWPVSMVARAPIFPN